MKSFKDFLKEAENVIIDIRDKGTEPQPDLMVVEKRQQN